jgi:hypothetical protein
MKRAKQAIRRETLAKVVAPLSVSKDGKLAKAAANYAASRVVHLVSNHECSDDVMLPIVRASRHEPQSSADTNLVEPFLPRVETERLNAKKPRPSRPCE